jgi:hypothetical protein
MAAIAPFPADDCCHTHSERTVLAASLGCNAVHLGGETIEILIHSAFFLFKP